MVFVVHSGVCVNLLCMWSIFVCVVHTDVRGPFLFLWFILVFNVPFWYMRSMLVSVSHLVSLANVGLFLCMWTILVVVVYSGIHVGYFGACCQFKCILSILVYVANSVFCGVLWCKWDVLMVEVCFGAGVHSSVSGVLWCFWFILGFVVYFGMCGSF